MPRDPRYFYKIRHRKTGKFVSGTVNAYGQAGYGKYGQQVADFASLTSSGKSYQTRGTAMGMITELAAKNAGLVGAHQLNEKDFPFGSDIRRAWVHKHFDPYFELVQYAVTEGVPVDIREGV